MAYDRPVQGLQRQSHRRSIFRLRHGDIRDCRITILVVIWVFFYLYFVNQFSLCQRPIKGIGYGLAKFIWNESMRFQKSLLVNTTIDGFSATAAP